MKIDTPNSAKEPDPGAELWRYMDLTKFLDLLTSKNLYFIKGKELQKYDKYEGIFPFHQRYQMRPSLAKLSEKCWNYAPEEIRLAYNKNKRKLLSFWDELCYVSCWHENSGESAAMWKIYASSGRGIAIKTTYQKLLSSLPTSEEDYIGAKVEYLDHYTEYMPEDNLYYPLLHKRLCYKHENEVRIIIFKYDKENSEGNEMKPFKIEGMKIPIKVEKLIDYIVLSPDTPSYFESTIKDIIRKYNYDIPVRYSIIN